MKIPGKELSLTAYEEFLEFVSAEIDGLKGMSVQWRDWDFVDSEANYFILG